METIKVENVKEAIETIYLKRETAKNNENWDLQYKGAVIYAYDQCIDLLENLIVRRQRNEP